MAGCKTPFGDMVGTLDTPCFFVMAKKCMGGWFVIQFTKPNILDDNHD